MSWSAWDAAEPAGHVYLARRATSPSRTARIAYRRRATMSGKADETDRRTAASWSCPASSISTRIPPASRSTRASSTSSARPRSTIPRSTSSCRSCGPMPRRCRTACASPIRELLLSGVTTVPISRSPILAGSISRPRAACASCLGADVPLGALVHARTAMSSNTSGTRRPGAEAMDDGVRHHRGGAEASLAAGSSAWSARRRSTPAAAELIRDSYAEAGRAACRGRSTPRSRSSSSTRSRAATASRRSSGWRSSACSGRHSIVGHGIFLDDHRATPGTTATTSSLLAETGTTVAHCPTVFMRRGIALRRFRRAIGARGVQDRNSAPTPIRTTCSRRCATPPMSPASWRRTRARLRTTDIFEAATLGGAAALGRDDIGRLVAGAARPTSCWSTCTTR